MWNPRIPLHLVPNHVSALEQRWSLSLYLRLICPMPFCTLTFHLSMTPTPIVAVLEVLVFGRDAGMAEAWLCSQEPLVRSAELGCTVDEVESLIKRHEAFQKSAVAWEERFSALEKLTAVRTVGPQRCPTPLLPHFFPSHRTASLSACELRVLFCSMSVSLGATKIPLPPALTP